MTLNSKNEPTRQEIGRRDLLAGSASALALATLADLAGITPASAAQAGEQQSSPMIGEEVADKHILLVSIEGGPENRLTVDMFRALGAAFHRLENDSELRVAVLYAKGPDFCGGLDLKDWGAALGSGQLVPPGSKFINPVGTSGILRSKPVVVAVQGLTAMLGHELMLAADIRVAASDARFHQGEVTRALFPGGGATLRFVREAGWGNAMRYMLTGDEWNAEQANRMGLVQEIAPAGQQFEAAMRYARKIAGAAPLGVQATLQSQQLERMQGEQAAFVALLPKFGSLFQTQDFRERQIALQQNRPPVYVGH